MTGRAGAALLALFLAACGSGDNTAVRSFYATVKPAISLLDAVREGEAAQKQDASFSVVGQDCPGPHVELGRGHEILHIRVTQPQATSNPSSEPGYAEVGYARREEFVRALTEQLPSFYPCKRFRFEFGRKQFWPTTDSFTVTVNPKGEITSVELKEDET